MSATFYVTHQISLSLTLGSQKSNGPDSHSRQGEKMRKSEWVYKIVF